MSFFKKKKSANNDKKFVERLQSQQYLAKFEPTTIVDYSDCNLNKIPSGTCSLCNLFLKEVLILHTNRLKNLKEEKDSSSSSDETDSDLNHLKKLQNLRVLDLHNNIIDRLPDELFLLINLQYLNSENNRLQVLPFNLFALKFLQTLNLKRNLIKELPKEIGLLSSLRTLDISINLITNLPGSLINLKCLEVLLLDHENMKYPKSDICAEGTTAILKFLCDEANVPYVPSSSAIVDLLINPRETPPNQPITGLKNRISPSLPGLSHSSEDIHLTPSENAPTPSAKYNRDSKNFNSRINQYETIKEQKRRELAKLQKDMLENCEKEALIFTESKEQKQNALSEMEKQNKTLEAELNRINEIRELDRLNILNELKESDEYSKTLLEKLLDEQEEYKKKFSAEQAFYIRQNEENFLKLKLQDYDNLRKRDMEKAMQDQIRQICDLDYLQRINEDKRREILQKIVKCEKEENENLEEILKIKQQQMNDLLKNVSSDEQMQKRALLILMQKKDERLATIQDQLQMIQDELTKLTIAEMKNRDIKDSIIQQQLVDQREGLKMMMNILMEEREKRSKEFRKIMAQMEKQRIDEQADYWLVQYQRLLDSKPDSLGFMEKTLDSDVKQLLIDAKATLYLPILAQKRVTMNLLMENLDDESFFERIGVHDQILIQNLRQLLTGRGQMTSPTKQEATSPTLPTLKAHFEMECVVCMERKSSTIFLPCGHVCCCHLCDENLQLCPLCRTNIDQKIDLSCGHYDLV